MKIEFFGSILSINNRGKKVSFCDVLKNWNPRKHRIIRVLGFALLNQDSDGLMVC